VKLGTRLALLSVLLLSLPLAGWQLVRSLEHSLRDSYQQTLIDTARAIAGEIASLPVSLPPLNAFYVHSADHELVIDGHASDWTLWLDEAQPVSTRSPQSPPARVVLAERRGRLHVLIEVDDPQLRLTRPGGEPGDRIELELTTAERTGRVTIAPLAPGWLTARGAGGWPRLQAALQPADRGWTIELAIERPITVTALGLRMIDVDDPSDRQRTSIAETESPRPLARPSDSLSTRLTTLLPENTRGWVTGPDGWILGRADRVRAAPESADSGAEGWLLATAAARLLGILPDVSPRRDNDQDRLEEGELRSDSGASWYQLPSGDGFVVSAGAPVVRDGEVVGHVVIERSADRFMAQAYRSLLQLFVFGLVAMLILASVLIGFAGWLSARIRRLRNAAESAVGNDGKVRGHIPAPKGSDEIADLGRSLTHMVERQRQHQDYLQTLASKLSHELRTPLAMIRSSLDNLAEVDDAGSRERYRQRAQEGCLRLQGMFQAMSQAARIEESLADDPLEDLDLGKLVADYTAGCRRTFGDHTFAAVVPTRAPARIAGCAEQLAQLLDKLIDNAVAFSPTGSRITLRVVPQGKDISLQVDNPGSRLPEGRSERLFESMVSQRSGGSGGAHLGLGLHVVRLIAQHHGGRVRAIDRPGGVRFQVDFPRLED